MTRKRPDFSGHVLHILNRRVDRNTLFYTDSDYVLFRDLMAHAAHKFDLRILEWVLMPNHWHMLVWPETKNQVPNFMHWLNGIHAKLWRENSGTVGNGSVYQSRYKAFPVCPGFHLHRLRNYLAMNPVKAYLAKSPFEWKWGSAKRVDITSHVSIIPISRGPEPYPKNIRKLLTTPIKLSEEQIDRLNKSLSRGLPYGNEEWTLRVAEEHQLEYTYKSIGRPKLSRG